MSASGKLTAADRRALEFLRREAIEQQQWNQNANRAQAIRLLGEILGREPSAPLRFGMTAKGWRIGTGNGAVVSPPSDSIGVGLAVLELAVSQPHEPQPVHALLFPGVAYKDGGLSAARKYVTQARDFVHSHCPALAGALKAVEVSAAPLLGPVATYRPAPEALPILTR